MWPDRNVLSEGRVKKLLGRTGIIQILPEALRGTKNCVRSRWAVSTWAESLVLLRTHTISSSRGFRCFGQKPCGWEGLTDTQMTMLSGTKPASAMCVQSFDDSRDRAIRITYRISLRSSSLWEPRRPLLKVVYINLKEWSSWVKGKSKIIENRSTHGEPPLDSGFWSDIVSKKLSSLRPTGKELDLYHKYRRVHILVKLVCREFSVYEHIWDHRLRPDGTPRYFTSFVFADISYFFCFWCGNDPSAGSPTETLLRLHLPLSDKI